MTSSDPLEMYLTDIMTVAANLAGNPAVSIPAGTANGMPVGLQLIGAQTKDYELLSAAQQIEETIL